MKVWKTGVDSHERATYLPYDPKDAASVQAFFKTYMPDPHAYKLVGDALADPKVVTCPRKTGPS
jgi:hypothetical protein